MALNSAAENKVVNMYKYLEGVYGLEKQWKCLTQNSSWVKCTYSPVWTTEYLNRTI